MSQAKRARMDEDAAPPAGVPPVAPPAPTMVDPLRGMAPCGCGASSVLVKVCGVRRPEDAKAAMAAGADLVGIIFARSKRTATTDEARRVVRAVRDGAAAATLGTGATLAQRSSRLRDVALALRRPLCVGVWMDQPLEEVAAQAAAVGVDCVQLHGSEGPEYAGGLRRLLPTAGIIKVLHLPPAEAGGGCDLQRLRATAAAYGAVCDALLLDTSVKGQSGGTGEVFDWQVAKALQSSPDPAERFPVIVAGGLQAANVGQLIGAVSPFGVDCSSGTEVPGQPAVKDPAKIEAYVSAARAAAAACPCVCGVR